MKIFILSAALLAFAIVLVDALPLDDAAFDPNADPVESLRGDDFRMTSDGFNRQPRGIFDSVGKWFSDFGKSISDAASNFMFHVEYPHNESQG